MERRSTPLEWRKNWQLFRARQETDRRGDPVRRWNMSEPDYSGKLETASGVAWHIKSHAETVEEYGEAVAAAASFLLDDPAVEISPFDRCVFGGALWEVRGVLVRSAFRTIELVEVSKWPETDSTT